MDEKFSESLNNTSQSIFDCLSNILTPIENSSEIKQPNRLIDAMRHGTLNGGKRIRPFLFINTAKLFEINDGNPIKAACAIELVHCYSLIHDDLPAMDDDDFRRNQPTVHKKFDEATAILAGDSLLTLAFEILADKSIHDDPQTRLDLIIGLAKSIRSFRNGWRANARSFDRVFSKNENRNHRNK